MRTAFRSLGTTEIPASSPSDSPPITDALPAILQTVQSFTSRDAFESVEVLQAKIKNYQDMKRRVPAMAWFYDNEIRKMQAKLVAAQRAAKIQAEGEQATRDWRTVGYLIGGGAVVVAIAGAVRLIRSDR